MCVDPATLSLAATIGSTTMSAISAYQGAQSQKAAYNAQAAADEQNAVTAQNNARRALDRGDREQQKVGADQARVRGEQRAALAANGVDLEFGSAAATLEQTDYYGAMDQMTTAQNAEDDSTAYRQEAANRRASASFQRSAAKAINPWMSAGSSLLSNASQVADKWSAYKKDRPATYSRGPGGGR